MSQLTLGSQFKKKWSTVHRFLQPPDTLTETSCLDNEKVWEIIAQIMKDSECWTYVKPAHRTRDGRKVFWALHNHYLGPNNMDHLASEAKRKLSSTLYYGEKKRWNFLQLAN